jgi:hypothetical protein
VTCRLPINSSWDLGLLIGRSFAKLDSISHSLKELISDGYKVEVSTKKKKVQSFSGYVRRTVLGDSIARSNPSCLYEES